MPKSPATQVSYDVIMNLACLKRFRGRGKGAIIGKGVINDILSIEENSGFKGY